MFLQTLETSFLFSFDYLALHCKNKYPLLTIAR